MAAQPPPPNWLDLECIKAGLEACIIDADKMINLLEQCDGYYAIEEKRLFLLARIESTKGIYVPEGSGPSRRTLRRRRRRLKWRYFWQYKYHKNFHRMVEGTMISLRMIKLAQLVVQLLC